MQGVVVAMLVRQRAPGILRPALEHGLERAVDRRGLEQVGLLQWNRLRCFGEMVERHPTPADVTRLRRGASREHARDQDRQPAVAPSGNQHLLPPYATAMQR